MTRTSKGRYTLNKLSSNKPCSIWCSYNKGSAVLQIYGFSGVQKHTITSSEKLIRVVEKAVGDVFCCHVLIDPDDLSAVMAAINTKNLAQNLVRVKSSNVWAYGLNIKDRKDKTGDLIVQFKDKNGGPGSVYIYYDFPSALYKKWQSAPSKGHFFWVYIRNNYRYSKLSGDRIGKLPNAINHYGG